MRVATQTRVRNYPEKLKEPNTIFIIGNFRNSG